MTLIALDPGVTTGYVIEQTDVLEHGQCKPDAVWDLLDDLTRPLVIVCESFQYRRQQLNAVLTPVEVIGVVKEYVRQHPDVELHFQTPAMAKSYWNDQRLKMYGLWFTGEQHARDAARHILYYKYFGHGKGQYGQVSR
jgi:RNAse (barnase) inhibitor barstar